ncbi:hypothetical protein LSPH24S_09836 [Lysinibacillus sphaericus]
MIGFNTTILAHEYLIEEYRLGDVHIGNEVMVGANSTILENFEEALEKIEALRAAGKQATLQLRSSLVDEAAFLTHFTKVVVVGQEEIRGE